MNNETCLYAATIGINLVVFSVGNPERNKSEQVIDAQELAQEWKPR